MIGDPKWFSRRKYTGWGLTPATWQGWVYAIIMVLPIAFVLGMDNLGTGSIAFLVVWGLVFVVDMVDIMLRLGRDERERVHEAIAERNALWAMLAVLAIGIGYQVAVGVASRGVPQVDPFILAALGVALVVKMVSNFYLDRKD